MHLRQNRDTSVLQALDEPDLPKRPVPVEWVGHETASQVLEFPTSSRLGHRDLPDVIDDVEFAVLDEPWPVEPQRRPCHSIAQLRHLRKARSDEVFDRTEAETWRVGRVADRQSGAVHVPGVRLGEPERSIYTRQPPHVDRVERAGDANAKSVN